MLAIVMGAAVFVGAHPTSLADDSEGPSWWPTQGEWMETQVLRPGDLQDPSFHLMFGSPVVIDGDTLLVSTQFTYYDRAGRGCQEIGGDGCDWVYVFNRGEDGLWRQHQKLVPSDARVGDSFGYSLALDEASGLIVVGNPGPRVQADTMYVFERDDSGTWNEILRVEKEYPEWPNADRPGSTSFGVKVAVDGRRVAVADLWTVYVLEELGGEWTETAVVDGSAHGLALSGDTLITTPLHFEPSECNHSKRVYVNIHKLIDGEWVVTDTLDPQREYGNRSQTSVQRIALNEDGTALALGAYGDRRVYGVHTEYCIADNSVMLGGTEGSVWVYELVDGEWVQTADIPNPTPQPAAGPGGTSAFAVAIDLSGERLVVGADGDMYNGGIRSGAAYVYEKVGDAWRLQAKLRNNGSEEKTTFGRAVGISGDSIAVGADFNTRSGAVHMFKPGKLELPVSLP